MKLIYEEPQVKVFDLWIESEAMVSTSNEGNLITSAVEDDEFDM